MNNISVLYSEEELALSVKKLGAEIDDIFKNHDKEKHIRGGEVTRQKYKRG